MVANQQRSVIKFWVPEKYKPYHICSRMCDIYEKACLSQKKKEEKFFK